MTHSERLKEVRQIVIATRHANDWSKERDELLDAALCFTAEILDIAEEQESELSRWRSGLPSAKMEIDRLRAELKQEREITRELNAELKAMRC